MPIDARREIDELVAFEGRWAGTDAERRAARHLEQRLDEMGRDAETEPTVIYPNYPVTHAIHALIAIVGSVLSVSSPGIGAALVLFAAVSTFGDLSGSFYLVRRLTGRRASQNVTSREDGDKRGVVILSAHYDAARGGAIFSQRAVERRATFGRLLRRPIGPFEPFFWSMLLILVCAILRLVGFEGTPLTIVQFIPTVVLIASIPLLIDIALSGVAEGANDNASGVATALRLADRYGGRLENFDLWVVFPGAQEALLAGMREWMRRHKRELDPQRTVFLNLDSVGSGMVRWVDRDGIVLGMRYHPSLIEICEDIAEGTGEGNGIAARDGSDALIARTAGFPAITITARNAIGYAPERVDDDSLERTYEFCAALLERLDESVGAELA